MIVGDFLSPALGVLDPLRANHVVGLGHLQNLSIQRVGRVSGEGVLRIVLLLSSAEGPEGRLDGRMLLSVGVHALLVAGGARVLLLRHVFPGPELPVVGGSLAVFVITLRAARLATPGPLKHQSERKEEKKRRQVIAVDNVEK